MVIESINRIPTHLRDRVAGAMDSGFLSHDSAFNLVRRVVGADDDARLVMEVLKALGEAGVSVQAGAEWLRSLNRERAATSRPELVWTGPEPPNMHARETRRVYEEMIGQATRSLWISTYAFYDGRSAFEQLSGRMDALDALEVNLVLNISRQRGDTSSAEEQVRRFADRFWNHEWPGRRRPRVLYDPRALAEDAAGGVLHAKAVVRDEEAVFVTSANWTEAAFDRNIELGVYLPDRTVARGIVEHFRWLIQGQQLSHLPGA